MLVLRWYCVGAALVLRWCCVGTALVLRWCCVGAARVLRALRLLRVACVVMFGKGNKPEGVATLE